MARPCGAPPGPGVPGSRDLARNREVAKAGKRQASGAETLRRGSSLALLSPAPVSEGRNAEHPAVQRGERAMASRLAGPGRVCALRLLLACLVVGAALSLAVA